MPTLGTFGLTAAYVTVALLLLVLNLYARWPWPVKAAVIVLVTASYFVTYHDVPDELGWPTAASLPARFRLLAVAIDLPNPAIGDKGRIYLWATDESGADAPRAYVLPYSKPLRHIVHQADEKLRQGIPLIGEDHQDRDHSRGLLGRLVSGLQYGQKSLHSADLEFFQQPAAKLPPK